MRLGVTIKNIYFAVKVFSTLSNEKMYTVAVDYRILFPSYMQKTSSNPLQSLLILRSVLTLRKPEQVRLSSLELGTKYNKMESYIQEPDY